MHYLRKVYVCTLHYFSAYAEDRRHTRIYARGIHAVTNQRTHATSTITKGLMIRRAWLRCQKYEFDRQLHHTAAAW